MDVSTESFAAREVAPGFVGAYPAATIGKFLDEQVLADQSDPAGATA